MSTITLSVFIFDYISSVKPLEAITLLTIEEGRKLQAYAQKVTELASHISFHNLIWAVLFVVLCSMDLSTRLVRV